MTQVYGIFRSEERTTDHYTGIVSGVWSGLGCVEGRIDTSAFNSSLIEIVKVAHHVREYGECKERFMNSSGL